MSMKGNCYRIYEACELFAHKWLRVSYYLSFIIFYLLFPTWVCAATYTPDNLPIPYLQDKTQYVSNPDRILSQTAVDSLNLWLEQMETEHGVQTVLAVVERIEGGDTYEFCMALGRKYGIGSKEQNTGLIILLSTGDRAYTILTGRGLEGTLPDAICKRIENCQMLPALRESDWDEAMLATVRAITKYVDGDPSLVGGSDFEHNVENGFTTFGLVLLLGIGLIIFAVWKDRRRKSYCPSCHQYKMKRISSRVTTNRILGIRTHHDIYRCTNCHFTKELHWDEHINSGGMGAAAGGALGSSLFRGGGGFRGGGFGGHFGGGSFGGGGASGRF